MAKQKTIGSPVSMSGVGLMLGKKVNLTLKPADADEGINFVRTDLPKKPLIKASVENLSSEVPHCTSLKNEDVLVVGVEHLLSAVVGMGIDNLTIELDNEEPPIGDGSAADYVELIEKSGIKELDEEKRTIFLDSPVGVSENGRQLVAMPSDTFKVTFLFDHPKLSSEVLSVEITPENFKREISRARTFCFESEAEEFREKGLGMGGSADNVVLLNDETCSPIGKMRFENGFVRHKILDLIGDLALCGMVPQAHIVAVRSGHDFNAKLVELLAARRGWLETPIEATEIYSKLPHRYPFMMLDRVLALEPGKRIVALKNVSYNENFFQGHFPGHPVMPGVLQTEAIAQAGGYLLMHDAEEGAIGYFATIDEAKFRRPVIPGDQLVIEVEVLRFRRGFGRLRGVAKVDGQIATEAEFVITVAGGRS